MNTPLFRSRCNAMLSLFKLERQIPVWRFDGFELDVLDQLAWDGKIGTVRAGQHNEPHFRLVDATPYPDSHDLPNNKEIHPLVLELAAENPHNAERLRLYKKNV